MVLFCQILNRNRKRTRKTFFHRSSTLSKLRTHLYNSLPTGGTLKIAYTSEATWTKSSGNLISECAGLKYYMK